MSSNPNPFAALLASTENISAQLPDGKITTISKPADSDKVNDIVQKVFHLTLNKNAKVSNDFQLLYLEDLAYTLQSQDWIDLEVLEQALFERLLLPQPQAFLIPKAVQQINSEVCEREAITYLYNCYLKLGQYEAKHKNEVKAMKELIMRNVATALKQPDLFEDQNVYDQMFQLVYTECSYKDFFINLAQDCAKDEDGETADSLFAPLLEKIHTDVAKATLVSLSKYIFEFLQIFSSNETLATLLLNYCEPKDPKVGTSFSNTLLGALLSLSVLPKTNNGRYEFFDRPLGQVNTALEGNLWSAMSNINQHIYHTFLNLLKCGPNTRNRTLTWLGQCLDANAARGKLWNSHVPQEMVPVNFLAVADGFMINLSAVLLKLCAPFCSNIKDGKVLKVDPTYCALKDSDTHNRTHLPNMSEETCLLPALSDDSENSNRPTALAYNFVTECFYLAHRSLDLGFRVSVDHFVRLTQEMIRIQRAYQDALNQGGGRSDVVETIHTRMEFDMQRYFSLKATLLEPSFISALMKLHTSTSYWLTQVALHTNIPQGKEVQSYAPTTIIPIKFPLPEKYPDTLRCIPEFIVENVVGFMSFLRRFSQQTLEEEGYRALECILTMVLTYMGAPERMRNPHLRARLAECLEAMLPRFKDEPEDYKVEISFQREKLFTEHPHRNEIVRNLLDVFVGIEMTGQSVQFEQKFNYRRPMYVVMDYLWSLEEHRNSFIFLADEAEKNMEAVVPPIFLRFVNLLMNDAVFLLDESLTHMAQIRTLEIARDNNEWNSLPPNERDQNRALLQHTGMLARFDNILGRDTTHTLRILTANTTSVFTHSTMVDRVAAMLNYFLFHLVGPNKKNFKVKDPKEFEFDPANIVLDICHIYVSLANCDPFCLAISQDGRSYSPKLFPLAEDVLARIGGGPLISELRQVAGRVDELAIRQKADEEALSDIPDDFLDPIMSTLMLDPVILPSSRQTVDRTTIARHLLSDQSDPFNRSPLTMDQVVSNTELSARIRDWVTQKRAEAQKS